MSVKVHWDKLPRSLLVSSFFNTALYFTIVNTVVCLFSFAVFANSHDKNTVSVEHNIKLLTRSGSPYNIGESSEFVYQRVACVLESMNYHYKIESYPWKRAQKYVEKNVAHGFFPASTNADRERLYTKSLSINDGYVYWVSLSSHQVDPKSIHQDKKLVGVVRGTNAFKWAIKNGYKAYEVSDQNVLTSLLTTKRVEVILTSRESLDASGIEHWKEKLSLLEAYPRIQHVFFSKTFLSDRPNFLNLFNAGINECILRYPYK